MVIIGKTIGCEEKEDKIYISGLMINKEYIALVLKDTLLLEQANNNKRCQLICGNTNIDLIDDSVQQVSKFLEFYVKEGYMNKSLALYLSDKELLWIGSVFKDIVERLYTSKNFTHKYVNIVGDYLELVNKTIRVHKLIATVVNALRLECIHNNLRPYITRSKCSASYYVKPDLILKSIRVSDHVRESYIGGYTIICCLDTPLKSKVVLDGTTYYYATEDSYMDLVREIIEELAKTKEERISKSSTSQYASMVSNTEKCNYKFKLCYSVSKLSDFKDSHLFVDNEGVGKYVKNGY